jgi:hypothetical protein
MLVVAAVVMVTQVEMVAAVLVALLATAFLGLLIQVAGVAARIKAAVLANLAAQAAQA